MKDVFFKTIMLKGESGAHVSSFVKTSTVGNVDTYLITFDDGTTEEFTVTNGNGIYSIDKTATSGYIDTYTITYEDGSTSTFEITNGVNGAPGYEVPAGTIVYYDNSDTPQGYEPSTNPNADLAAALDNKADKVNLGNGEACLIVSSYSDLMTSLLSVFASMSNNTTLIKTYHFNFSDHIFGGTPQPFILYRYQSGVYRAIAPAYCIDGFYINGSWTWRRATMETLSL